MRQKAAESKGRFFFAKMPKFEYHIYEVVR